MMSLIGKKIEITNSNFSTMVREGCLLVDKSLMIRDFIEGQKVSLITRPRRFGKTLNLSMLHHFFAADVRGTPTKDLFHEFAIAKEIDAKGLRYMDRYQGQYPVVFITFKDVKERSFQEALDNIKLLISLLYDEHRACLSSDKLIEDDVVKFKSYLAGASQVALGKALFYLSQLLYKVHKKKVILLIDEYDSPLTSAYEHGYLEELSDFMRNMFSSALKDNDYLEKGLMTGILRVSQSSMLSGLNNLAVYTLLNEEYEQYFGFTESEVFELMSHLGITESLESIRHFYNGYKIGSYVVYNPWSLMNYLKHQQLEPYWVLSCDDKLLKELLLNSCDYIKKNLSYLIAGHAIEAEIRLNLTYDEFMENRSMLWTLLLFCGYLTVETTRFVEYDPIYQLKIPNREVMIAYKTVFIGWLEEKMGSEHYHAFLNDLIAGRINVFLEKLTHYLLSCTSSQDLKNESNYYTFILGLVSGITATHHVILDKETSIERPDLVLIPKNTERKQGFILEFKHIDYKKQAKAHRLHVKSLLKEGHQAVLEALHQINSRAYDACFSSYPYITEVVKIGIAFTNRLVSAGSITTPIQSIRQANDVLTKHDITFYDAYDRPDSLSKN